MHTNVTETEIKKLIMEYMNAAGYTVWVTNAGYARRNIKLAPPGTPDIIGYSPKGRFVGIEVKKPGCRPTEIQEKWHEAARSAGCEIHVATSVEDICGIIES